MKTSARILLTCVSFFLSIHVFAQSHKHVVQQGETVYAIARKYGVSPNDILRLNPNLGNGDKIRPGQSLVLPAAAAQKHDTPATEHPVATQTIPQSAIPQKAPVTYTIELPQKSQNAAPAKDDNNKQDWYLNSGCKEMYRIQKKDNLYRIALNYNLSIEEICEANPGLKPDSKLKKGEWLCIPFSRAEKQAEADSIAAVRAAEAAAHEAKMRAHKDELKVAVILPLKDKSDKGSKMLEFYRGMLMAADSVKQQGTSVSMYASHSGSSVSDMKSLLTKAELKQVDIIFGPLERDQASVLSDFCMQNNIRLVMPFSVTNAFGQNNPYAYQASISSDNARRAAADIVAAHFTNCNYVALSTGNADDRGSRFTSELRSQLSERGNTVRSLNLDADDAAFAAAFNQFRDNLVIPDVSSSAGTAALVKKLKTFKLSHPEYKIALLGYPEWIQYNSLHSDFYTLDTYVYSAFYCNPSESRVTAFENRFKRNFKKEIVKTFPRYGLFGFDLGYYFMNGLSKLGEYFDENQSTLEYRPFQNAFRFDQRTASSAHTNHQIYLVHYKANQKVEVIK